MRHRQREKKSKYFNLTKEKKMLGMCLCACAIVKEIKERDVRVSSCIHKKEGKRERGKAREK